MGKKTFEEPELKETKEVKAEMTPKQVEEEYTADEYYKAARSVFGVAPELVRAAFRCKGVTKCSKNKAIQIVEEFKNKEVK